MNRRRTPCSCPKFIIVAVQSFCLMMLIPERCLSFDVALLLSGRNHHHHHHHCYHLSSRRTNAFLPPALSAAASSADDEAVSARTVLEEEEEDGGSFQLPQVEDPLLENAAMHVLEVFPHKPLGCTVEESLADGNGPTKHVFVSKVVEGGNAESGGLAVGDIILGVTSLFGGDDGITDVSGLGIDKVKGLVAGRPREEPLLLRVARGTTVVEDHERALVDMCSDPNGISNEEMEQCMLDYLKSSYALPTDDVSDDGDVVCENGVNDDGECILVDDLYNMWAEADDLPIAGLSSQANDPSNDDDAKNKPAVKPWSSRSSPSGTFVRDPSTGKMKNIDA